MKCFEHKQLLILELKEVPYTKFVSSLIRLLAKFHVEKNVKRKNILKIFLKICSELLYFAVEVSFRCQWYEFP